VSLEGAFEDVHGVIADWLVKEEPLLESLILPLLQSELVVLHDICQHGLVAALDDFVEREKAVQKLVRCGDVSADGLAEGLGKDHLDVGSLEICHGFDWYVL
jgi:hypothetical protein